MGKNIELFEGIRSGIFMILGVMDHSKYLLVLAIFFISINSIGQTYDQGALIRSNTEKSLIYLIFTGDEFGDGSKIISKTLKKHNVKAHFFFTGNFYRNAAFENSIKKLKKEGHYLGAHSDRHLLYVSWEKKRFNTNF